VRLGLAAVAACGGAVALLAGPAEQSAPPAPAAVVPAPAVPGWTVTGSPATQPVAAVRVRIPAIGVDSDLATLGVDAAGALVPPADFGRAGWFGAGPVPGDVGPAVLAGHVDSRSGPAIFYRLAELTAGDAVEVLRSDGRTVRFGVTRVARYPKDGFPTAEVYGATAAPELRLITCGGTFDRARRSYRDNVVVFANAT
jgi:sortase (surface protein transpeptidase)